VTKIDYVKLDPANFEAALPELAEILHACVSIGASISFIQPFTLRDAKSFWSEKVFPKVQDGSTTLLVAKTDDKIVGTVQMLCDLPPNQAHRCEVAK
jgi:hypothetical protein